MRVFVAGASGALGTQLIPQLLAAGHEVVAMVRSPSKEGALHALGARTALADALDRDAVARAVGETVPDVIVHQLTALSGAPDLRHPDRYFAMTNRLRTEGTDHLLAAGRAAGVRRVVAQSYAGWPYARTGGPVKTESDPLDPDPPAALRTTLAAIRHVEEAVTAQPGGVVLRYGGFYGPGTGLSRAADSPMAVPVRKRQFPLVGGGGGVWSFIHIEDAATATVAAVQGGADGIYNIVDDEPAPVREWLPALADALGAKPPLRVPRWLGRLAAGEAGAVMMTEVRGASNAKAKRELGWRPRYASWREGFAKGLG
ncbi:NAD-dependent epimerase/dehydratase family protein [Nonomuraea sp. NPDC050556]|uniref:NAD-dependent epimerase/dehydratase family protein n=1 Tax=Nonomuraea sp. NPDC050556 TaxID=3364369 RepID=UPI0037A834E6